MKTTNAVEQNTDPIPSIYNQKFWLCYIANVLLVTANSLTFRFAEFVAFLGGGERIAGTIVSVGMIAAFVSRFLIGPAIDRYGTRWLWRFSALVLAASCLLFLTTSGITLPIYFVRILFAVSMACMFSCLMVYIQQVVPARRRMEVIATLGTSGFVGMTIGPFLGDVLFGIIPDGQLQFAALFITAALLVLLYFLIVLIVTRDAQHTRPKKTVAVHRLLLKYWPGQIVWVAIILGGALTVPTVFLTRYSTHLNLGGIGTFFVAYSTSAFAFRLLSARWMGVVGLRWVILIGMTGLGVGQLLFMTVATQWHFVLPAIVCGMGHALLFPAVVASGAGAFPKKFRGSGTTLILGFTELGIVVAAPLLGALIEQFGFSVMFIASGLTALTTGVVFCVTAAEPRDYGVTESLQEEREAMKTSARLLVPQPHVGDCEPAVSAQHST